MTVTKTAKDLTRIQNTRRQDQKLDFHPHTASTHVRNDYASINAYIDK
jgi:hypothetical protein